MEEQLVLYLINNLMPLLGKGFPSVLCITCFFILFPVIKTINKALNQIVAAFTKSFTSFLETAPKVNTALERIAKSVEKIPNQLEAIKSDLDKSNREHIYMMEKFEEHSRELSYIKEKLIEIAAKLN